MNSSPIERIQEIFAVCRRLLKKPTWKTTLAKLEPDIIPERFPDKLKALSTSQDLPEFIGDLARIEYALYQLKGPPGPAVDAIETLAVNPILKLVPVTWRNLVALIKSDSSAELQPQAAPGSHVLVWRHPQTNQLHIQEVVCA